MIPTSTKFFLAFALQVIVILALVIVKLSVLESGTEVFLRIAPVDPRDPLRGDYVTFQYEISRVSSYQVRGDDARTLHNGDDLYVVLQEGNPYWYINYASTERPNANENQIFLKGKIVRGARSPLEESQTGTSTQVAQPVKIIDDLTLSYGMEQYFIPEGKGNNFSFWNKEAGMRIKVDANGKAVPDQLFVDGKKWP